MKTPVRFQEQGKYVYLTVRTPVRPVYFFPQDGSLFTAARRHVWTRSGAGWTTRLEKAVTWAKPEKAIRGVLVLGGAVRIERARLVFGRLL